MGYDARIATIMTTISGTAASRVNSPSNSKSPLRNSTIETKQGCWEMEFPNRQNSQ
jgi:hypothetical protein